MEDTKAWKLFRSMFKDGDEVILIDEDDLVSYGKMTADDVGVTLTRRLVTPHLRPWEEIRFMSHDGFPVRKLFGADGSRLIEKLDTSTVEKRIRESLVKAICVGCKQIMSRPDTWSGENPASLRQDYHEHARCRQYTFGDPFQIDPVQSTIVNPGNTGEYYWGRDDEELLFLRAKDGAAGILADLSTVYFSELCQ